MSFGFGFGLPRAPLRGQPLVAVIRSLFANNEPGVWYDPSDLSTLYQDSAGTTPVTRVEQPVGLMLDKSKGLVLGPELVTNGTFDTDAGWSLSGSQWGISNGKLNGTASGTFQYADHLGPGDFVTGRFYIFECDLEYVSGFSPRLYLKGGGGIELPYASGRVKIITQANISNLVGVRFGSSSFVGSIDNISVRELPGNHAFQTTTTSRPVLSARYNLLTKTEQFDDAVWTKLRSSITANSIVAPDGTPTADKLVEDTSPNTHYVHGPDVSITAATAYTGSIYIKQSDLNRQAHIFLANANATSGVRVGVDLTNGAVIFAVQDGASNASAKITPVGNDWYYVSVTGIIDSSSTVARLYVYSAGNVTTDVPIYTGDGTSGIYIWGADLRVANDGANLPPYQRVNTATDYDTVGFPHYLRFDGVDDWLVTNTITPGIDKVQVFAGVRKLSDAISWAQVCETSAGGDVNNGTFQLTAPGNTSSSVDYSFYSHGTAKVSTGNPGVYLAPTTNGLTGLGDISGDSAILRVNGTQAAINTGDQGTGNFLSYPLYIGRRGGTAFPFNGHIYSLIVRFGSNLPAATIEKTEKYINTKTRAY